MSIHHDRLTTAIDAMTWCNTSPHDIDKLIGLYAEKLAGNKPRWTPGTTPEQMLDGMRAADTSAGHGKGGHADPTANTALRGEPGADDADETIGQIRHSVTLLAAMCDELDCVISTAASVEPSTNDDYRTLTGAIVRAEHAKHHLTTALELDREAGAWAHSHVAAICDTATWLREKAGWIWTATHGETMPVAEQRALVPCKCCARWKGRADRYASRKGLCGQCANFQDDNKCWPTETIVGRWESGRGATPGDIIEAKAARRGKAKAS